MTQFPSLQGLLHGDSTAAWGKEWCVCKAIQVQGAEHSGESSVKFKQVGVRATLRGQ